MQQFTSPQGRFWSHSNKLVLTLAEHQVKPQFRLRRTWANVRHGQSVVNQRNFPYAKGMFQQAIPTSFSFVWWSSLCRCFIIWEAQILKRWMRTPFLKHGLHRLNDSFSPVVGVISYDMPSYFLWRKCSVFRTRFFVILIFPWTSCFTTINITNRVSWI